MASAAWNMPHGDRSCGSVLSLAAACAGLASGEAPSAAPAGASGSVAPGADDAPCPDGDGSIGAAAGGTCSSPTLGGDKGAVVVCGGEVATAGAVAAGGVTSCCCGSTTGIDGGASCAASGTPAAHTANVRSRTARRRGSTVRNKRMGIGAFIETCPRVHEAAIAA